MLEPVNNKISFPEMEKEILSFWEEHQTFKASLELRKDSEEYVFYDGPPFATGLPHYGHLLPGTIKDIIPRYQTMRRHYVERRFGWDCHGLPIEALAQEELGLAGAAAIKDAGVDVFNEQCRSMVQAYVAEWEKTVNRLGRWVDFENDYKTMDLEFMESVWWVFKQLWDKDRIYKAFRVMPYSWKLTTPLSNLEATSNYKDVDDPSITIRLRMRDTGDALSGEETVYGLAWTTTPWTLPGNLALCVGPSIDYVAVRDLKERVVYVLAESRLDTYFKNESEYETVSRFSGSDLEGWTYEPLFPYFADHAGAFRILADEFVSTEEGTGLVHIAPAYGEDDYRICRAAGIELVDYLDTECAITDALPEYAGRFCKDADKDLIRRLKDEGKLVHHATLHHSYPFCERTDTPLIYRAIDAWYVRIEDMRDQLSANNDQTHWAPAFVGEKRFGNWLKDARDWNISRNRFWGSCIPVWVSEDREEMICVGSIEELEELSGHKVTDLHKHVIDEIVIEKDGKTYRRTPEVLDCWFESGSMPYAQPHYPFENKEWFDRHFPADFIAESLDQTRGWFYYLLVLSTSLFKRPAFKNVIVSGMILAEDGRKMSKRLKNYPDPTYILDEYGADALRLYLMNSPLVQADKLNFSETGVKHALRHLLIPWWNAYSFFVTYARIDEWEPVSGVGCQVSGKNVLDRWILSSLERLNHEVVEAMDVYDLQRAVRPFVRFIEDLTNWYIRRSRRRFWKSRGDEDKDGAYATLYEVLLRLSKIAAPFVPFISESIYRNLRSDDMPESVHLCDYPLSHPDARDRRLEGQMESVMSVVGMGRQLRTDHNLKIRQPLKGLHVISHNVDKISDLSALKDLITDELNVKDIWFNEHETELASLKAKPDFKKLGPKLGPRMKKVAAAVSRLSNKEIERYLEGEPLTLDLEDGAVEIGPDELIVEREAKEGLAVASEGDLVVALETELSEALIQEGLAREFVNKVQSMRKSADLDVVDRIVVRFASDDAAAHAIDGFSDYVKAETLAVTIERESSLSEGENWDLNGHPCTIRIERN